MARWYRSLSLVLLLAAVTASAESLPRPFEARYSGRFSGIKLEIDASLTVSDDGTVSFRRYSEPRGFVRLFRRDGALECGRYRIDARGPVPDYYAYVDGKPGKGKSATVDFADDRAVAASTYRQAAVQLDVSDGAVDKIAEEPLAAARLRAGDESFTLRVVVRNEVHNVTYRVLGEERVTVDAGTFDTVFFERRRGTSSRTTRVWAAPELDYQPVRIQRLKDGNVQGTATLDSFEWLDQARGSVTPVCP